MNIVLLSGGSGKRLWPLSNNARSKQFLKLLECEDKSKESMVQRVYRQIGEMDADIHVTVATSVGQVDAIRSQLGADVDIVTEPERRDTYPAIMLAAAYLYDVKHCGLEEPVIVMPVDPYTEQGYFDTIQKMEQAVRENAADIVLMGIDPAYPSEKYGYILPKKEKQNGYAEVRKFVEKPDALKAAELIADGALWNGGVFAFRLGYLIDKVDAEPGKNRFDTLLERYHTLKKISFDYEIVEKADRIAVTPFCGMWKDLGTWNTLSEEISADTGLTVRGEGTEDTKIVNELNIPVVALGVKDMVIAASPDGILVSGKDASSFMKPYVEALEQRPMYEERRWGEYKVYDYSKYADGTKSLTKHVTVNAGCAQDYHVHKFKDEVITVANGKGELVVDGCLMKLSRGDTISIRRGQKHAIRAFEDLQLISVQISEDNTEGDTEILDWSWAGQEDK